MADLLKLLAENPYPGRGILIGSTPCSKECFIAYFIMGRSQNSRNRVFAPEVGGIITKAADPALMQDPSLIIYAPVRTIGTSTIVSNGDQTDTIHAAYASKKPFENTLPRRAFEDALSTRTFEPDSPNYTPRISGVCEQSENGFTYKLSILKSAGGDSSSVQRFFYNYPAPVAGKGHFISTYQSDGDPLPSFAGEPISVDIPDDTLHLGDEIWRALNPQNKVSLFTRRIPHGGVLQDKIYNKYQVVSPLK